MIVHLPDIFLLVLSAKPLSEIAASQRLAAIFILYTYKNTYKLQCNPTPIQKRQYHGKSKGGKDNIRSFHRR